MAKRDDVIAAVKALVVAALPYAKVTGFDGDTAQPSRIDPGGNVIGHPGDAGEPESTLSPLTYHYDHRIPLEIAPAEASANRGEALAEMLGPIGAAIAANRTLGGLCDWIEAQFPEVDDLPVQGGGSVRWAIVPVIVSYSTTDPLN